MKDINEEYRYWIEKIINEGKYTTKGEENFAYDMEERISHGEGLNEEQADKLERIFKERVNANY